MLGYPQLAPGGQRSQVKSVGFSVGELRAYAEPTKEKVSSQLRRIEARPVT